MIKLRTRTLLLLTISVLFIFSSCGTQTGGDQQQSGKITQVKHPEWSKNLSIYEVNIRQFTPEGTFNALKAHLPRLKELGADIIWLMPVNPIGELNRKGTMGSYYSVSDYLTLNPEYGTDEDFKELIKTAHENDLYVIIDWVANHSAWDNALVAEHPEWYEKDSLGKMISPFDWTDVVAFDYNNPQMNDYMLNAMKFWVNEYDIDGYRCDVAGMVPDTFWVRVRKELDKIKPVFMLAEDEAPRHHAAFDMTYGWEFHKIMNDIYSQDKNANDIENYLHKNDSLYPSDAYRMYFITNHDENSWNGTEYERLGDGVRAFYVLTATVPGMPLIYTGQEAALDKRLEFFEKDAVEWNNYPMADFYHQIFELKKNNPALYNGDFGGNWKRINTGYSKEIFALLREKGSNKVLSIVNLSAEPLTFNLEGDAFSDDYTRLFTNDKVKLNKNESITLPAWGYQVYFK
ncbi:MAG: alpha-amylase family glycosyl hydrolase [Lentimicrobiaceae bacterium]|nr:alpha-amylase family glycosyl hydrolase [Lentimicrobiaceae bacterium]